MKKLILTILLSSIVQLLNISWAEDKLPAWYNNLNPSAGFAYSIVDGGFNGTATVELAKWKYLSLDAGYAGDNDSTDHKIIGALAVNLLELKKYVQLPILDKVVFQPFAYFGVGRLDGNGLFEDSETDYGVGVKIVSLTW